MYQGTQKTQPPSSYMRDQQKKQQTYLEPILKKKRLDKAIVWAKDLQKKADNPRLPVRVIPQAPCTTEDLRVWGNGLLLFLNSLKK